MNLGGPIVLIDDDKDDLDLFSEALSEIRIQNEVLCFNSATKFLEYFSKSEIEPFFILCDVNMPEMSGFQMRRKIYDAKEMEAISIPFIYFSTSNDRNDISTAYELPIQGYFQKPAAFNDIKKMFILIIAYWTSSFSPVLINE